MENYQNYERVILPNAEESLSKIVNKIADNSVVLDIGCGPGVLGKYLFQKKGCIVDGVDADKNSVEIAKSYYRTTAVRNLEVESISDVFIAATYDYIVLADILEHIVNPDKLLSQLKSLIKSDGTIIFSVPNITHAAAGFELLLGNFEYKNNGLLDNTHLKFYSKKSLLEKLESFGLFPYEVDTVKKQLTETEFKDVSDVFPASWLDKILNKREDALTYQWLVSTKIHPQKTANTQILPSLDTSKGPFLYSSILYWSEKNRPNMSEDKQLIGHLKNKTDGKVTINFYFSDVGHFDSLAQIRIDPIADKKPFLIHSAQLISESGQVLWSLNPESIRNEFHGAQLIDSNESFGCLFQATSSSPHWFPVIGSDVLALVNHGTVFRLVLKADEALLPFYSQWMSEKWESLNVHLSKLDYYKSREVRLLHNMSELREQMKALNSSTFWRITWPARVLVNFYKKVKARQGVLEKADQLAEGLHLALKFVKIKFKLIALLPEKVMHLKLAAKRNRKNALRSNLLSKEVLKIEDLAPENFQYTGDFAVHIAVDQGWGPSELLFFLENIPRAFSLYVSVFEDGKIEDIKASLTKIAHAKVVVVKSLGCQNQKMSPLIENFGGVLAKHNLVLSLNLKKASLSQLSDVGMRRYLLESVLGKPGRAIGAFEQFRLNPDLGVLFPATFSPMKSFNEQIDDETKLNISKVLDGIEEEFEAVDHSFFPLGGMFWFRGECLEPFLKLPEGSRISGVFERLFPFFAGTLGFKSQSYIPKSVLSAESTAYSLDLFRDYVSRGLISNSVIMFDHNGGGGTNVFTRDVIRNSRNSVVRVYFHYSTWIIQWIAEDDGLIFQTESIDELFSALDFAKGSSIIVNSLYGFVDLESAIAKIIEFSRRLNISLDFKVHDFYALCVSPHLLNYHGSYCGVPGDQRVCQSCLRKNLSWYHVWYPTQHRPHEIDQWRKPFAALLEAASTITFFDKSSVEVVRKAFKVDESKIRIVPHKIEYLKNVSAVKIEGELRIGVMGTLTAVKGVHVVNSLQNYIDERELKASIIVIGPCDIATLRNIKVHGQYEHSELPQIFSHYGINTILMPSIIPETFSYTISEAMMFKLPIVAFDIGAQGNRVKEYEFGQVVPLGATSDEILEAIQSVTDLARKVKK